MIRIAKTSANTDKKNYDFSTSETSIFDSSCVKEGIYEIKPASPASGILDKNGKIKFTVKIKKNEFNKRVKNFIKKP